MPSLNGTLPILETVFGSTTFFHLKVFFQSLGVIRPLVIDLIHAGTDIMNPRQISSLGMNPKEPNEESGIRLKSRMLSFYTS